MTLARWRAATALFAVSMAAAACGSSTPSNPNAPSSINVAGTWTGTFTYTTGGVTVTDDASLVLTQPGGTASGSWSTTGGTTGTLSFVPQSTVSGAFTIVQPNVGSSSCSAASAISGTASSSDLVLNVAGITPTAACPWGTAMKFVLHK